MNQPWVYMCPSSYNTLPSLSPFHPSGWSQCIGPKCPVSCNEPELTINFTFGNVYVSVLFSQIIPPSTFSHRIQKRLSVCLFCCLAYRVIITIFLNSYKCINTLYWCFPFWLNFTLYKALVSSTSLKLIQMHFLMAE